MRGKKALLLAAALAAASPGKVRLLDFWATWCPDCVKTVPVVQAAYEKYGPRGLDVEGVLVDDDPKAAAKFAKAHGLTYRIVPDDHRALADRYGVHAIPTLVLLGPDGKELGRWLGDHPEHAGQIDAALNRIMGEWAPPKKERSPTPGAGG